MPPEAIATPPTPPVPSGAARASTPTTSWSVRHASITAGAGLLLMAAFAIVGNFVAVEGLVTPGDAAATATDVAANASLFRAGVASLFAVAVLDVVVACALYRVFAAVHAGWSLLAAAARLTYAAVFLAAISHLQTAAGLFTTTSVDGPLTTSDLHALGLQHVETFGAMWSVGLGLFGLHLLAIGLLAVRAGFVNRVLAALLVLAGAGYVVDGLAAMLAGEGALAVSNFTFVGEVWLALWLLVRGGRVPPEDHEPVTAG